MRRIFRKITDFMNHLLYRIVDKEAERVIELYSMLFETGSTKGRRTSDETNTDDVNDAKGVRGKPDKNAV